MRKITVFFRNGGISISKTDDANDPKSIGQRFSEGFIVCEDDFWGKPRVIVINLADVTKVILEDE